MTPSLTPIPNELFELLTPSTCRPSPVMSPADVTAIEEQRHATVSTPSRTWPDAQVCTPPPPPAAGVRWLVGSPAVLMLPRLGLQVEGLSQTSERHTLVAGGHWEVSNGACPPPFPPPPTPWMALRSWACLMPSTHICPNAVSLASDSCLAQTPGGTSRKQRVTREHFFSPFFLRQFAMVDGTLYSTPGFCQAASPG